MANKIKILLIIPGLVQGGAQRAIIYIANNLNKEKYDVSLILYDIKGDFLVELSRDVYIYDLDKRGPLDFVKLIFRKRQVIKNLKPDIILSFMSYTNIVTGLAVLFLKRGIKTIFSERNYPPIYLQKMRFGWVHKLLMKFTYQKADFVIANSLVTKIALEKYFKVSSEKLKTIYNPIDIEKVTNLSNKEVFHPFFDDRKGQVIIGVGRLTDQKRFDKLLRLLAIVKKQKENIYLIIIGDGELRDYLAELAEQLNIANSVDFVGFKENPYSWISKADIFVLCSDYEGFPNVLLESMACGTPVVSSDCMSGPRELIVNWKNGILVPPDNIEEMSIAVSTLLNDKDLRNKFSKEGIKRAKEFSKEKILPQYEELFLV